MRVWRLNLRRAISAIISRLICESRGQLEIVSFKNGSIVSLTMIKISDFSPSEKIVRLIFPDRWSHLLWSQILFHQDHLSSTKLQKISNGFQRFCRTIKTLAYTSPTFLNCHSFKAFRFELRQIHGKTVTYFQAYRNDPSFRVRRPGQTVQTQIRGTVWSGSTLFAIPSASFGRISLNKATLFNF